MTAARNLIALLLGLAMLAAPGLAQARTRHKLPLLPTELSLRHDLQIRPSVIGYTGDGSGWIGGFDGHGRNHYGHLHWTQWTRRQATGHGAVWIDGCTPDCAAGVFHPYAVTVYATRPQANVFRRLTLRYRYRGKLVVDRRGIVHQGRGWSYTVLGVIPSSSSAGA